LAVETECGQRGNHAWISPWIVAQIARRQLSRRRSIVAGVRGHRVGR
jgi:DNA primase catalytic subunit